MAAQTNVPNLTDPTTVDIQVSCSLYDVLSQESPTSFIYDTRHDRSPKSNLGEENTDTIDAKSPEYKSPPPKVLYHLISKDEEGTVVVNDESAEPIPMGDTGATKTLSQQTVLEVLTTKVPIYAARRGKPILWTTCIKIYSTYLINALRHVVDYWPGLNLQNHPVIIQEPYAVLVHHLSSLESYKTNHPTSHSIEYMKLCNDDIDVLLRLIDELCGDNIRIEQQRHHRSPPMATFENLWMLFRPGQDVYIKDREGRLPIAMRVGSLIDCPASQTLYLGTSRVMTLDQSEKYSAIPAWDVRGWGVACSGVDIASEDRSTGIEYFEGEREIFSLNVYPKDFHDDPDYERQLQRRGQRYWEFCSPVYRNYHGTTLPDNAEPPFQLIGRVVIDFQSHLKFGGQNIERRRTPLRFKRIDASWMLFPSPGGCECEFCITSSFTKIRSFKTFDSVKVSDARTHGEPHLYFLSDYILRGYALKEQKWLSFHIDQVHDLKVDEAPFDNLILPGDIKNTIQSIVWSSKQPGDKIKAWSADSIQEKGEGQIFLLHGTPGVGKTCTAEIVADYMKRPLLPLTCGDLGITAHDVQESIDTYFELGEQWGAVILMDEADIYLEQRAPDQLERNSLVSVFLRALEYFRGILFITTNRVGTFDDAFISRIHVALYYPPLLDNDRVQIWENNFRRLEKDAGIKIPGSTRIFTTYDEALKRIKWNGREIRNAIQTAVALAKKDANDKRLASVVLEANHIKAVVKLSRSFKAYIDAVHDNVDEAGRARQYEARADHFNMDIAKGEHGE